MGGGWLLQWLQCISRMNGRWLVVAVVVVGCCSV